MTCSTWSRVGLTALIVVTKATLGDGTTTLLNSAGAAVGAFAPLLGPNNVCGNPSGDGGPMQAIVLAAGGPVA